jgi:hypothetical protein
MRSVELLPGRSFGSSSQGRPSTFAAAAKRAALWEYAFLAVIETTGPAVRAPSV